MCRELEKMRKEVAEEAAAKAAEEAAKIATRNNSIKIALALISKGFMTSEEIAELCDLTLDEVASLAKGIAS